MYTIRKYYAVLCVSLAIVLETDTYSKQHRACYCFDDKENGINITSERKNEQQPLCKFALNITIMRLSIKYWYANTFGWIKYHARVLTIVSIF